MRVTSGIGLGLGVLFMGSMVISCTASSSGVYKKGHRLCAEHSAGAQAPFSVSTLPAFSKFIKER
jgi:hypothetical protein